MSMGPSYFLTDNYNVPTHCAIQNGVGLHAPAATSDGVHLLANIIQNDRMVLWNTGAAPASPVKVDVTVSATTTPITCVGIHALRAYTGYAVTSIKIYYQTGGYDGTGTWTLLGTITSPGRDSGLLFASTAVETIRYEFYCTGGFQTGKLSSGLAWAVYDSAVADLGSRQDAPTRNVTAYTLPSGSQFVFRQGDNSRQISLAFSNLTQAQKNTLHALATLNSPFVHIDTEGSFWDCLLASKTIPTTQTAPNPLFQCRLDLVGLP